MNLEEIFVSVIWRAKGKHNFDTKLSPKMSRKITHIHKAGVLINFKYCVCVNLISVKD
jgi:hypothetical protein